MLRETKKISFLKGGFPVICLSDHFLNSVFTHTVMQANNTFYKRKTACLQVGGQICLIIFGAIYRI